MRKTIAILACVMAMLCLGADSDLGQAGNELMKPLVRVSDAGGTGSGTVVYSADRGTPGEFRTFVLTNYHVIADSVKVVKVWDSLTQAYKSEEQNEQMTVELFSYLRNGKTVVSQPVKAMVYCHKEAEDLALLELDYPLKIDAVAPLLPRGSALLLLQPVWAVGCSLGADPLVTEGKITDLEEMIDRRPYIMASANIIYGNSGGAIFTEIAGKRYLTGIPSRVTVMRNGQALTHMGFFIGPERLWKFFDDQKVAFILDEKATPAQADEARKAAAVDERTGQDPEE